MINLTIVCSKSEIETVRELFEEYAAGLDFSLDFQNYKDELKQLPGEYAPPGGCIVLAYIDCKISGVAALRKIDEFTCEMKRLFVKPEFRGYKIGRILSEKLIEIARNLGYSYMRLDTISSMKAAIALYKSLGFTEIPKYRENPFDDALFFELKL